ncbi:MAG: hypothetical protein WCG27_12610 [Pseudomonadota bacterium]
MPTSSGQKQLTEDLHCFEEFLKNIGFKRIEGSIYGLLTFSKKPLSSEQIQKQLKLSQSAVSNALKPLVFYGALQITDDRERGCRVYQASDDCLSIVANVLRMRESSLICEYKRMAKKLKDKSIESGDAEDSIRIKRLSSIVEVCEFGEVIVKFILSLDGMDRKNYSHLQKVTKNLPRFFDLLIYGAEVAPAGVGLLKEVVSGKVKGYFNKWTGKVP